MTPTATSPTTRHTDATLDADLIDSSALRQLVAEDPRLRILDVRSGGEFDAMHIAGSYNVPLDTLAEHSADLATVDHPVVLVCKSGARADTAHATLTVAGKHQLHILDGGLDAWLAADGDVVRGTTAMWAMDRQVRLVAGSMTVVGLVGSIFISRLKWLAGAIGAGLTFSAMTNSCAMGAALAKLPYNRGTGCDIDAVLREMTLEV